VTSFTLMSMRTSVVCVAAVLCVANVAAASPGDGASRDGSAPGPISLAKVLVLPLAPTQAVDTNAARAFDARLLVALSDTGRVQTVTSEDEPECTTLSCLASLGTQYGAAYVLQLSAVPESGTLTLFGTLVDVKTASAWRRIELSRVAAGGLAKTPAELVPQVLGPAPGSAATLAFARPASIATSTMTTQMVDQLTAMRAFKVLPIDTTDRSTPTHRAELIINDLSIAEPRRGICKWYEGTLSGTFAIVDLSNGRVVWSKPITTTVARRVHFSSRTEVTELLESQAVAEWMTAFRSSNVLRRR
jgi:hypothetical protein